MFVTKMEEKKSRSLGGQIVHRPMVEVADMGELAHGAVREYAALYSGQATRRGRGKGAEEDALATADDDTENSPSAGMLKKGLDVAGSAVGNAVGEGVGAAIGSVVPGIGTAIGGAVGGALGGAAGGSVAAVADKGAKSDRLKAWLASKSGPAPEENSSGRSLLKPSNENKLLISGCKY